MATRVTYPIFKAFTASGTFGIGYKLYTYEAGTDTPLTVYKDEAGTIPHTNPILLNAKGEEEIFITEAAKFTLTDADGNIQTGWPVDDIDPTTVTAAEVSYVPSGSLSSTNVQDALDEIIADLDSESSVSGPLAIQVFTASGTYTKTTGATTAVVEVVGGGGGGAGSILSHFGSGGSGGGYARKRISLSGVTTETVTIGAAGSGGTGAADGTAGGTTSFGAHVSATGGGKGKYDAAPDAGGNGTGGDLNVQGGTGKLMTNSSGGDSFYGTGGGYIDDTGTLTSPAYGYGGGGSGSSGASPGNGTAGTAGICIVTEY